MTRDENREDFELAEMESQREHAATYRTSEDAEPEFWEAEALIEQEENREAAEEQADAVAEAAAAARRTLEALPATMTLGEILTLLELCDSGAVVLTEIQKKDLGERARFKVDGYQEVLETCDLESERFKRRIKSFAAAKKSVERKATNLRDIAAWHMRLKGFDTLPGSDFTMRVKTSERLAPKVEPSAALYVRFSSFIRSKFEWKKADLKKAIKAGDAAAAEVAELKKFYKPEFKPRTKVK